MRALSCTSGMERCAFLYDLGRKLYTAKLVTTRSRSCSLPRCAAHVPSQRPGTRPAQTEARHPLHSRHDNKRGQASACNLVHLEHRVREDDHLRFAALCCRRSEVAAGAGGLAGGGVRAGRRAGGRGLPAWGERLPAELTVTVLLEELDEVAVVLDVEVVALSTHHERRSHRAAAHRLYAERAQRLLCRHRLGRHGDCRWRLPHKKRSLTRYACCLSTRAMPWMNPQFYPNEGGSFRGLRLRVGPTLPPLTRRCTQNRRCHTEAACRPKCPGICRPAAPRAWGCRRWTRAAAPCPTRPSCRTTATRAWARSPRTCRSRACWPRRRTRTSPASPAGARRGWFCTT
jgi:hypothetical protein